MMNDISSYLDTLFPNPKCELNYNTDYQLLIAVMLSAQTTDKRVNKVTGVMFSKYPSLDSLAKADLSDIEMLVRELGNFKKKAKAVIDICNILLNDYSGIVPKNRRQLESLPMVGRKTTSVVLSELFNEPNIAVDTHVERTAKRLGFAKEKETVLEVEKSLKRKIPKEKWCKAHLQLVHFGRYYCTAKNPNCKDCKLKDICTYQKKKS